MVPKLANPAFSASVSPALGGPERAVAAVAWGLCALAAGVWLQRAVLAWRPLAPGWRLALALLPLHGMAVAGALAVLLRGLPRGDWAARCGLAGGPTPALRRALLTVLWALPALWTLQAAVTALCRWAGMEPSVPAVLVLLARVRGPAAWVVAVAALALWAPLVEEVLFRLVLADALSRAGTRSAALGGAVVFALAHGSLVQFPTLLLLALILQRLRFSSGGLWAPVLAHALMNGLALLAWSRFGELG